MSDVASEIGQSILAFAGSINVGSAPDYMPGGANWPITRTAVLFFAILVTLVAILLLYGGNLQNTNIGPISIRSRVQTAANYFKGPRDIVSSVLEGKSVRCTFYVSYLDHRGKTRFTRIGNKSFVFKLSALNKRLTFSKADMFGHWNAIYDQSLQDAFVESGIASNVEDKNFFVAIDRSDFTLKDHAGDDDEIVAVSSLVWDEIAKAHSDLLKRKLKRFQRFYVRPMARRESRLNMPERISISPILRRMQISTCACISTRIR
jgi:hypothetical protein